MTTTIHPNATIITNFIRECQTYLIESECFDEEYLTEQFPEVSIIGLLHLSDGEINEMFEFKSPKFCEAYHYMGYKHRDIEWDELTDSDDRVYNLGIEKSRIWCAINVPHQEQTEKLDTMTRMNKKQIKKFNETKKYDEINGAIEILWNNTNLCEDMMSEIVSFI